MGCEEHILLHLIPVFPSSAGHHRQMRRSALSALSLLFHTASALEQARLAGYKTTTPDFRQAPHLS